MKEPQSVADILDDLEELADDHEQVSIAHTVEAFGERSWGPLILVPPLIEISPIGGIPGVPTFLALLIALVAVQMVLGRDHLWLPGLIENRCISGDKLAQAADKLRGTAERLDRWFHGRWKRLTQEPFYRIAGVLILLLCAAVPPLELLPFASTVPMLAIAAFGLALMVRDGVLMVIALALATGALGFGAYMLLSGVGPGG